MDLADHDGHETTGESPIHPIQPDPAVPMGRKLSETN